MEIVCKYCTPHSAGRIGRSIHNTSGTLPLSEGIVELVIEIHGTEYKYIVPDAVTHLISVHKFSPCPDFVDLVMFGEVIEVIRMKIRDDDTQEKIVGWYKTKGYTPIGYLNGEVPTGDTPSGFASKLQALLESAE